MEIRKLGNEQPLSKDRPLDITRPVRRVLQENTPRSIVEAQARRAADQARQELSKALGAGGTGHAGDDLEISTLQRTMRDPAVSAALAKPIDSERQAELQALRQAYTEGQLNTPERIERSAMGMLAKQ